MRLIDADALIEVMRKTEEEAERAMTCPSWWGACNIVKEQPTAYDVEAVVAELEKIKKGSSGCSGVSSCKDCKYTNECFDGEKTYKVALDNAIEIVRGKE